MPTFRTIEEFVKLLDDREHHQLLQAGLERHAANSMAARARASVYRDIAEIIRTSNIGIVIRPEDMS